MTTANFTTVIDHTSTAGFRAWGSELSTQLAAVGLVQTADTGQINWATVTYTTSNGVAQGYEIWRFVDSTLFLKIEYGTGPSGAGFPGLWITVGTGSNGTGTLTGASQISTRNRWDTASTPASTVATYTSYISRTAGHLAIAWKTGGSGAGGSNALGFLIIGKTVDGTGATTTTGYAVIRAVNSSVTQMQCVRLIASAAVYTETQYFCVIAHQPTTSLDSAGNYQCYQCEMVSPDVTPFMWAGGVVLGDIAKGVSFSVNMVGAAARTYLSMGSVGGVNGHNASNYGLAMLYE